MRHTPGTRRRSAPRASRRKCGQQIRSEDWSLVNGNLSGWPQRLWNFDKHHQYIGVSGGSGIGYGMPAAIGAALANRKYGRLSVNIQNDGDMMYAPGVLWTAAHHKIPILTVMHNNRSYHEETMHLQRMGESPQSWRRSRAHRQRDRQPGDRLREARAEHGRGTPRGQSPIRMIWGRRWVARSPPSSAASRHSST